jgi:hypothetical protein
MSPDGAEVYINPDQTPAEAQTVHKLHQRRRMNQLHRRVTGETSDAAATLPANLVLSADDIIIITLFVDAP